MHAYWYMGILIGFDLFGWDFSPLLASHTAHSKRQRDSTHMAWTLSPDSTHPTNGEAGPERGIEKRGQVPRHRPLTSHWGVVGWAWTGQEAEILVICSQNNHWNGLNLAKKTQVLLLGIINFFFQLQGEWRFLKAKLLRKPVFHGLCHWIAILKSPQTWRWDHWQEMERYLSAELSTAQQHSCFQVPGDLNINWLKESNTREEGTRGNALIKKDNRGEWSD